MTLWIALTALTAATIALATWAFFIRRNATSGTNAAVYRAQLNEIDREEAAGLVSSQDAQFARTETQRRLITNTDADALSETQPMSTADRVTFAAVAGLFAIGSALIYMTVGRPALPSSDRLDFALPDVTMGSGGGEGSSSAASLAPVDEMMTQLEQRLASEPNDVEGWRMLGWSKFRTADYAGAARAYAEAVRLAPDDAETQSTYGEALARVSEGLVTPQAEAALRTALKLDPANSRARFLLGLKKEQDGKPAAAIDDWIAMLETAEPGADWYGDVRGRVVELASSSGIDVSKRLPPERGESPADGASTDAANVPAPGPTQADIAATQDMSSDDRAAMIEGMVARLDQKLRDNPADLDGWKRLIHARRVLNQNDQVNDALARARKAFAKDASALTQLSKAATDPIDIPPT